MSELLAIGVSHKTAPVEVRERLALPEARAGDFVRDLRGAAEVHEAVAISTCNRTELYLVVGDPVEGESTVLAMLASQAGIRPTELASAIYSHRNCEAARHLYRVTAGLESMIVGEAEIQGQIKRAYDSALAKDAVGPLTNHLFKAALAAGKRVRTETAIGERQLSLPGVAVALARERLGAAHGDVQAVEAVEELHVPWQVVGSGGRQRVDDDRCLLALELVHCSHPGVFRERGAQPGDLGVEGGDDEDIGEAELAAPSVPIHESPSKIGFSQPARW